MTLKIHNQPGSDVMVCYGCSNGEHLTIPDKHNGEPVRGIFDRAFFRDLRLEHVDLPQDLQTIGSLAFCECENLKSVVFPKKLKRIGRSAFDSCSSITNISLPYGLVDLGEYAFSECTSLKSVVFQGNGVTRLPYGLFYDCSRLEEVDLPYGLLHISEAAFAGTAIREIILPKTVKQVDRGAFLGCKHLKRLWAFCDISVECVQGCPNLDYVCLPEECHVR